MKKKKYAKGGLLSYLSPAYALSKGGIKNLLSVYSPAYMLANTDKKDNREDPSSQVSKASDVGVSRSSSVGKRMSKGGKVNKKHGGKVSSSRKCSHNRLY
jgi:hypothetical protein